MNPQAPSGAPDPLLGQLLDDRYQIQRKLGEGGMGEVYAAQHVRLGRAIALKLLRHEIVTNQEAVLRFEQEARSASSLGHKNIIQMLDSGKLPDGRIYLAMELLEGAPLNELLRTPLPADRLLNILIQTGHGLAAAHKKGIVHRDMKPENIFVTITGDGEEVPKLLDFGIAKMTGGEGNNHLTKTGTIFGTPFYMAPEQALGQNVDHRADVYAMGVIMYEIFGGAVPFAGESFMAILTQHITAEPKPVAQMAAERGRTIPHGVEPIIVRAMKKDPNERFQTMEELVGALVAVYRGIAGSGMSTYLEAALPGAGPSQMMAAAAPSPTPSPYVPHGAPGYGGAPGSYGTPPPPYPVAGHHQGHQSYPPPAATPYPGVSASFPPRPRRTGLIALAIVIVLGGAGAGGFFAWKQRQAAASDAGDAGAVATNPDKRPPPGAADAGAVAAKAIDAGAVTAKPIDAGAVAAKPIDAGAVVVAAKVTTVMVNSEPQGADVYQDGKKLPGRTPMLIKVTDGQPVALVLKRKRYEDEAISLDGTKDKVSPKLTKVKSTNPDPGPGPDPDPGPDKPLTLEQRCKKDPTRLECQLE